MITLRVIVDQMVAPVPGSIGRYTEELTRALIETAPAGCEVQGIVSASSPEQYATIENALPGLAGLHKTTLPRRELSRAWQLGVTTSPGPGLIHSPSLLAPLRKHDRLNDGTQVAVTIHDVLAWTHPKSLTPATVSWTKAMMKRARKHADAVIVPTHAVADQLGHIVDLDDRVRVIGPGVDSGLRLPSGSLSSGSLSAGSRAADEIVAERVAELGLPDEYILTAGTLEPRKAITSLITAMGLPEAPDLPLIVLGPDSWGELDIQSVADEAGLAPGRVRTLTSLSDEDLAVVMSRASVFVFPSLDEGFGLPMVQAFHFGTPVVHSDAPALVEVGGDAGLVVEREDAAGYPERLAHAMNRVLTDPQLAARLRIIGSDRSKAFSWRDSAERVWQLHADL